MPGGAVFTSKPCGGLIRLPAFLSDRACSWVQKPFKRQQLVRPSHCQPHCGHALHGCVSQRHRQCALRATVFPSTTPQACNKSCRFETALGFVLHLNRPFCGQWQCCTCCAVLCCADRHSAAVLALRGRLTKRTSQQLQQTIPRDTI